MIQDPITLYEIDDILNKNNIELDINYIISKDGDEIDYLELTYDEDSKIDYKNVDIYVLNNLLHKLKRYYSYGKTMFYTVIFDYESLYNRIDKVSGDIKEDVGKISNSLIVLSSIAHEVEIASELVQLMSKIIGDEIYNPFGIKLEMDKKAWELYDKQLDNLNIKR